MKLRFAMGVGIGVASLSGCVSTDVANLYVDNGLGSQYGNPGLNQSGETFSASGERCVIFTQDRPLSNGVALRVKTESCGSAGKMECKELSRTLIEVADAQIKKE